MTWEERLDELWAPVDDLDEQEFRRRSTSSPRSSATTARSPRSSGLGVRLDRPLGPRRAALRARARARARRGPAPPRRDPDGELAAQPRRVEESVALLRAELDRALGRARRRRPRLPRPRARRRRAESGRRPALALEALAPHLPRYQRSLGNYARWLDRVGQVRDRRRAATPASPTSACAPSAKAACRRRATAARRAAAARRARRRASACWTASAPPATCTSLVARRRLREPERLVEAVVTNVNVVSPSTSGSRGVMGEHEDRHVERRVVAPPAVGVRVVRPRALAAAEHPAAHDHRADPG